MSTQQTTSSGIGFCGMLTILFIGLKPTGYIDWSWLWVLSPLWLPITIVLLGFLVFVIVAEVAESWRDAQKKR